MRIAIFISLLTIGMAMNATRMFKPSLKSHAEIIESQTYEINAGQSMLLKYDDSYPGVYALDLFQGYDSTDPLTNQTITKYQLSETVTSPYEDFNQNSKYCQAFQRGLRYESIFEVNPISNQTSSQSFVDFVIVPKTQRVYILQNDNVIIQIKIGETIVNNTISYLKTEQIYNIENLINDANVTSFKSVNALQQFIECDQINLYCFAFTQTALVSFNISAENATNFQIHKLKNRSLIQDIYFDVRLNLMFAAAGIRGVNVFSIQQNGDLVFVTNITSGQTDGKLPINALQTKTNKEGTQLYILDQNRGLLIYDIESPIIYVNNKISNTNAIQKRKQFYIEVFGASRFDFYEGTFFIIAHTETQQDYALEVFVDFHSNQYYFNKLYSKDMQLFDVHVHDHWAILIGREVHRIVYHSVYKGFENKMEFTEYFEDNDLVKVENYEPFMQIKFDDHQDVIII